MDTLATLFQTKTVNSWAAWQCVITAILPGYGITNNKEKQESWHESVTIQIEKEKCPNKWEQTLNSHTYCDSTQPVAPITDYERSVYVQHTNTYP